MCTVIKTKVWYFVNKCLLNVNRTHIYLYKFQNYVLRSVSPLGVITFEGFEGKCFKLHISFFSRCVSPNIPMVLWIKTVLIVMYRYTKICVCVCVWGGCFIFYFKNPFECAYIDFISKLINKHIKCKQASSFNFGLVVLLT